jgi:hypothetical protein
MGHWKVDSIDSCSARPLTIIMGTGHASSLSGEQNGRKNHD